VLRSTIFIERLVIVRCGAIEADYRGYTKLEESNQAARCRANVYEVQIVSFSYLRPTEPSFRSSIRPNNVLRFFKSVLDGFVVHIQNQGRGYSYCPLVQSP
jgi:hypothetical protein